MSNAKLDANNYFTAMGVSELDGTTPIKLRVDPTTDYLECDLVLVSSLPAAQPPTGKIDENGNHVPCAYDATNGTLHPLSIEPTTKRLIVDLTIG